MSGRAYLDWNATAPLRPQARDAMLAALEAPGNPSSVHREGRAARALIEKARTDVAALVGAEPREIVFISGGTEANVQALAPGTRSRNGGPCTQLLVSAGEHLSVLAGGQFAPASVARVPLGASGEIDLSALDEALSTAAGAAAVSIMAANNETGVIQPTAEVARIVRAAGGVLHVDAVQAAGKIPVAIEALGADLLTISAHKLGGPKGVGALVVREGTECPALLRGGGQERGFRAGTENVSGIAGFGAAAVAAAQALSAEATRLRRLRDRLEDGLRAIAPDTVVFGREANRLPNTVLFATPGIAAETALIGLDLDGVAVSSGSACSSGKVAPSHVLGAMGIEPGLARGAVRASFGYATTDRDIDSLLQAWRKRLEGLPKRKQGIAA